MEELSAEVSLSTKHQASGEQLVKMSKLGKIYLKEIDIDEVYKDGDYFLFSVACLETLKP